MIALPQLSPGDEKLRIAITVEFFQNCLRPFQCPHGVVFKLLLGIGEPGKPNFISHRLFVVGRESGGGRRVIEFGQRAAKRAPFDFRIDGVQRCRPQSLLQILLFKILKRTGGGVEQIARCVETSGRNFGANLLDVIGIFARRGFIIDGSGVGRPTTRLAICSFRIRSTAGDGFLMQYFWADRQTQQD